MTVKEFYESIDGNYDEAMCQLRKEERIVKYLTMFLRDDSFENLRTGMEEGDMQKAFLGAHTLKGICGNLVFTRLQGLSSSITEDLRNGHDLEHAKVAYPEVAACYKQIVDAVKLLVETQNNCTNEQKNGGG